MAYGIRVTLEPFWIGDGTGAAALGQNQGNEPGYGAAQGPGPVPVGQTMMLMVNEAVPGGFNTAIGQAATDLETMLVTAGATPGFTSGTPLALIQGWSTGNP